MPELTLWFTPYLKGWYLIGHSRNYLHWSRQNINAFTNIRNWNIYTVSLIRNPSSITFSRRYVSKAKNSSSLPIKFSIEYMSDKTDRNSWYGRTNWRKIMIMDVWKFATWGISVGKDLCHAIVTLFVLVGGYERFCLPFTGQGGLSWIASDLCSGGDRLEILPTHQQSRRRFFILRNSFWDSTWRWPKTASIHILSNLLLTKLKTLHAI